MALHDDAINILLVDDKPDNLLALRAILETLGHNLVEAHSGEEALRRLLVMDFAVILLDVQMPGLNGFEAATLIRQRKRSEHTPIIFMSAYDEPEFSPAKAYTLGAVDFLQKPLEPQILRAKVQGLVAVARDAQTARRQAEQIRIIIEGARDYAIYMLDPDGKIATWNAGAERIYGYPTSEIVGQHFARFYTADDIASRKPWHEMEVVNTDGRYEEEGWRVRKDGSRFWANVIITALRDESGKLRGFSKVTRDITERRRAEETARRLFQEQAAREAAETSAREARHNEELFRFLADASKVLAELLGVPSTLEKVARLAVPHFADWCAIDLLESDDTLKRVTVAHVDPAKVEHAFELARRFPADANKGGSVWNIVRTGQPEMLSEMPDSVLAESIADPEQLRMLRALGLRSYMGVPLKVHGKVIGAITFATAESGRRFEKRDLGIAQDLAHRVGIALDNARLYAEAKEADRRKDEFLAMLGHELRNPLAPIANALQLMNRPGTDPAVLARAREITERQFRHMVRLVDDLLDVSRIMRGKIGLRKERVALATVIGTATEMTRATIESRKQQLEVALPDEPVLLEADPTRLAQVVANLLHNAAKYSDEPGRIHLSAERQGDRVVVHIKDEGMGIPPEFLPSIFELFTQGDRSLERSEGGLGIGLTVVRKLVEMHGGTTAARSDGPGTGSEFIVTLPALPPGTPALPSEAGLPPHAAGPPRRILVVDDNVDAAESMAMLLRDFGHQVSLAHDGPAAIRAAHERDPQVIILDIGLPEMNGYQVARALRQQPRFEKIVLIALTGYGQEEDRRRSREAGFDHHLVKPVKTDALQRLIAGAASSS
jgi:PAS domain S-box-containing protein